MKMKIMSYVIRSTFGALLSDDRFIAEKRTWVFNQRQRGQWHTF